MIEKETSKNNLETANDALKSTKEELEKLKKQFEKNEKNENNHKENPEKFELKSTKEQEASNDLENFNLDDALGIESKKPTQQDNQPNTPPKKNNQQRRIPSKRPTKVQEGLDTASNNLKNLPDDDENGIANRALKKIHEYLG